MVELSLQYIAGLFDGEGCIGIARIKPWGRAKTIRYTMFVTIGLTCLEPVAIIHKMFGGVLHTSKPLPSFKRLYSWHTRSEKAKDFLKQILPYLIVKKREAELAIEFREIRGNYKGRKVPDEELALREAYYQAMKQLKN